MNAILDKGKKWGTDLGNTLNGGGAAVFPHTFLSQCGYQIAAAVHAILDSGADQALILGVLHPMTESLMQARSKELNEEDISSEPSYGIFGPDTDPNDSLSKEFSLDLFKILFDFEVQRRGIRPPKLIERYPSLVNRNPTHLPRIREKWKKIMDGGQSPFEVAETIQLAIESQELKLWYQTSQAVTEAINEHFKDMTGNSRIPQSTTQIPSKL